MERIWRKTPAAYPGMIQGCACKNWARRRSRRCTTAVSPGSSMPCEQHRDSGKTPEREHTPRWTMFLTTGGEARPQRVGMDDDPRTDAHQGLTAGPGLRCGGAPQARRPGADGHHSRPAAYRTAGDQSPIDALRLPHRADRPVGASSRRRQLEVPQYSEAAIAELSFRGISAPSPPPCQGRRSGREPARTLGRRPR